MTIIQFDGFHFVRKKERDSVEGGLVLIACIVFSFPLGGPASDQFSVEENESSHSGKVHHHHRRHTHSQDTLCHAHTKNSEYRPLVQEPSWRRLCRCWSASPIKGSAHPDDTKPPYPVKSVFAWRFIWSKCDARVKIFPDWLSRGTIAR